ncbi:MAG: type II secretion system F family protein [Actinomycetota bacterium]|nr:type II secretion system F family protein [Actinomycetota bacterium]
MMSKLVSLYLRYPEYAVYVVAGLVFIAISLLVFSIGLISLVKRRKQDTMTSRLSYYSMREKEEVRIPSFFERVIMPLFRKIANVTRRFNPKGVTETTRHKLELAGMLERIEVNVYLMVKFIFAVIFLIIFVLLTVFFDFSLIINLVLLALIPLSYFFPDIYLNGKINSRQEEIRKVLPNALDMLTITVEAGMGFDIALSKVADNTKGPLGEEFNKMLNEMNVGYSKREAFRNLVRRTSVPDLDTFVASIIQADILGISIGKILRVQASEIRNRRSVKAEEAGIKAPVKLVFPLIFFLLPALLVIILGPGLITIYESLMKIL